MSNVLIGIIGVILFIGLALAGALFLGPQFQASTNNSRASAAVQAVSQVANAANMYEVQEGRNDYTLNATTPVAGTDLKSTGYLKSVPSNPTSSATTDGVALSGTTAAIMPLGGNAEAICNAIVKQTQGSAATVKADLASSTGTAGCYGATGSFTAFARI